MPKDSNEERKTTKKINHVQISDHELGKISENGEMAEFLMRGKASERHKPRMKLPKVSENGETEYKYNQEQYERFPLEKLFDRLGKTAEEELPKTGMVVNRRNMENIMEKIGNKLVWQTLTSRSLLIDLRWESRNKFKQRSSN